MKTVTIAVDAMGGDLGVRVTVPAVLDALKKHPQLHVVLVGRTEILRHRLKGQLKKHGDRLLIHHTDEVVEMNELPSKALRYKKKSSMRIAINLVKEGIADAAVSAGNTGALMATARFVLKTLPGVDRPAIVARIPSENTNGFVRMLDLGANVDCSPQQLQQFAIMGSILSEATDEIKSPKVALLNIGTEEIKGNEQVKQASELLEKTKGINYVGFAEGNDLFTDLADVIVSDGFVGNIALKVLEGEARTIRDQLKKNLMHSVTTIVGSLFLWPALLRLKKRMSPARYNGASLIGLRGIVIKSHGHTTTLGFLTAIERALAEVEHNVPQLISNQVQSLVAESEQ